MAKLILSVLAVLVASVSAGVLPTTYISRAPAFDSAFIKSDRLGGNFAYSVTENHAYAAHTPVVHTVPAPVTYAAAAPAITYAAPAVTYAAPALTYAAAQPAFYQSPLNYGLPTAYAAAPAPIASLL